MKTVMQDLATTMGNDEIQCLSVKLEMAARGGAAAGKRLRDLIEAEAGK